MSPPSRTLRWVRHRGRPAEFRLAQPGGRLHRRRRPVPRRSADCGCTGGRSTDRRAVTGADWRRAHLRPVAAPRNRRRAHLRPVPTPRNRRRARLWAATVVLPMSGAARRLALRRCAAAAHGVPARRGGRVPHDGMRLRGGRITAPHHMRPGRPPLPRDRSPGPQRHGGDTRPRPACPANRQHGGSHRERTAGHPAHQWPVRGRGAAGPGLGRLPG